MISRKNRKQKHHKYIYSFRFEENRGAVHSERYQKNLICYIFHTSNAMCRCKKATLVLPLISFSFAFSLATNNVSCPSAPFKRTEPSSKKIIEYAACFSCYYVLVLEMSFWNWNSNGLLIGMKRGRQLQRNHFVSMMSEGGFGEIERRGHTEKCVYHFVKGKRFRQLPADGPITSNVMALSQNLLSTFIIRSLKCFYGRPHINSVELHRTPQIKRNVAAHNFMVQHLNNGTFLIRPFANDCPWVYSKKPVLHSI